MLDDFLGYLLIKASKQVKQDCRQNFVKEKFPITIEQWAILHTLAEENGQTQRDLAEKLLKQKPNITRLIDILEEKKLVERKADEKDRRAFNVYITEEGRKLAEEIYLKTKSNKKDFCKMLTDDEIETLKTLLKKLLVVVVFVFFVNLCGVCKGTAAEEIPAYSLTDLYKAAIDKSEVIAAAKEDVLIAKIQKSKAVSSILPDLYTLGTYRRYSEEKSAGTGFVIQPETNFSWGAGVGQTYSLGGREFFNLQMNRRGVEKSKNDFDTINEDYLLDVAKTYYDILKAQKLLNIAQDNLKRLEKHRDTSKIRYEVGEVTKTVVLRAEAEVSQAQSEVVKAKNNLLVQKAKLTKLTNIENKFTLKETPSEINDLKELAELKNLAFENRSELKSMSIQNQIAKDRIKYTKSCFFPDVTVEGIYSGTKSYPSTAFGIRHSLYGQVSLQLNVLSGQRKAEVNEAKARQRQIELLQKDLINSVVLEVETAYYNALTQKSVLAKVQAQLKLAKDNYKNIAEQFKEGFASSIDVVDANNFLFSTEQQLADVKNDYEMSQLAVKRVTGVLLTDVKKDINTPKGGTKNEKL